MLPAARRFFSAGSGKPFRRERYGYLFGLKPGEKIRLTRKQKQIAFFGAVYLFGVYLKRCYLPFDSEKIWASKEALRRMIARQVDVSAAIDELETLYGMDIPKLQQLWAEHASRQPEGPTTPAYVIDHPQPGDFDWASHIFYRLPKLVFQAVNAALQ